MQTKKGFYKVFTQRCMVYLVGRGFVLQGMDKHMDGSGRNVFLFNRSEELNNAIKDFQITCKNR